MEITKTCTKCKETKSLDSYLFHRGGKDNKRSMCKYCEREIYKERYQEKRKIERRLNYLKDKKKRLLDCSKSLKKGVDKLTDFYIRRQIQKIVKIPKESIPQELIELKRIQLKTHRLCVQLQK
jgi:hypothetical protein